VRVGEVVVRVGAGKGRKDGDGKADVGKKKLGTVEGSKGETFEPVVSSSVSV
ncbi:hypothetical protein A2U01_0112154, partial [Trifolium medium]|nr:hypothetical protein [Trifolium medium]